MRLRNSKTELSNTYMALCSFTLYYLLAFLVFDWSTMCTYFFSFFLLIDNAMYHTGVGATVFQLSSYLKKKKFHLNESNRNLIIYSTAIFIYTLFIVFLNDYCVTLQVTDNLEIFWKSIYIRSISSLLISTLFITKNYGQVIQENTLRNQQLQKSLQKESEKATKAQMNMLKLQLDPHFMFNSLNTLLGLIEENPHKAEDFTLELSRIYKYIVGCIDKDTISLQTSMSFIRDYCQLIEIRYPHHFLVEIEPDIAKNPNEKIPPLSLQLLVENAIKHNQHSVQKPLQIKIKREGDYVCVTNTLCPYTEKESSHILSMGIGMQNLNDRYKLICDRIPIAMLSQKEYTVKIPII